MELSLEHRGSADIIQLKGRIDINGAEDVEAYFNEYLAGRSGPPHLVADLSEVDFISSTGLRVFVTLLKTVQGLKGKLALFGLGVAAEEVFAFSGFDKVFTICQDEGEAVAAVAGN